MIRPPLLGFSDFFDEVGAVKPPSQLKPVAPPKPGASKPTSAPKPTSSQPLSPTANQKNVKLRPYGKVKQTTTVRKHGQVMSKAKDVLLKAARGIGKAQVSLAKKPPAALAAKASTAMRAAATKANVAQAASAQAQRAPSAVTKRNVAVARGAAARAILGAVVAAVQAKKPVAPVVAKNLSPKAKAAIEKHNKAVVASRKAAQALAKQTLQTRKSVQALAKAAVNQKKVAKALRTKGSKAHVGALVNHPYIGEEVAEALLGYYETVGAMPDPMNPGFLDDGSPDPAFYPSDTPINVPLDPNTGMPMDSSSMSLIDASTAPVLSDALSDDAIEQLDNLNAAQGLPPMPPDQPTEADYRTVGGILYNESKGRPNGFVGSYGLMTRATSEDARGGKVAGQDAGINDFGYVWGSFDQDQIPNGTPWGGRLTENTWNIIQGRYVGGGSGRFNWPVDLTEVLASTRQNAPSGPPYGPLIGNPGMSDFKGMRVDAQGNMFWYPQEAPDWLTAPLKQAAALTEAKIKKAAEDEAKQFALEEDKKRRDEAATKAADDAANALAESQAASQARIAQQGALATQAQEEAAQAQQETAAEAALVEAQRADTEQQTQQFAQEQQAQTILLQRAQRQEQLMQANPDIELALLAQQAGVLGPDEEQTAASEEDVSYEDTAAYSEPEAETEEDIAAKFRTPMDEDDYEASGLEDDSSFFSDGSDYSEG